MGLIDSYRNALTKQRELETEDDGPGLSRWFRQLPMKQKIAAIVIPVCLAATMIGVGIADFVV